MDGDRPVVDGRDIFESELQGFVREVFEEGWEFGIDDLPSTECGYAESAEAHARHDKKLHELIVSYFDGPTGDVGTQDEAPEERKMGDGVRSEGYLSRLMSDTPYKLDILTDGTLIFRLWNLPQNRR